MNLPEIFGYIASGLVLATFSMRTMIPLRLVGICSNIAFIAYGFLAGLYPVLILHLILLPLNFYRFFEMYNLIREIRIAADSDHELRALLPYMNSISRPAGSTLFKKGDSADAMYILTSGHIRLAELGAEINPGDMVGEIGMFSPNGARMGTAVCIQDCKLQRITAARVRELVYQNPRIGFYFIGVVTNRLLDDVKSLERKLSESSGAGR